MKHRIGIDARFYGPLGKGLGRYTQEIVDRIIALDKSNEYFIFLTKENFNSIKENGNVHKVLANVRWYSFAEQFRLPKIIAEQKLDLMHFTHFNVPIFCKTPFIVTIHDLILFRHKTLRATKLNPLFYWVKNLAYRIVINLAVKRARKIIAVSEFTKKDIVEHFKIQDNKVVVTYEGVAELNNKKYSAQEIYEVLNSYKIKKPYLLYVGNAYPHKNLEKLIQIFNNLNIKSFNLIFVGKKDFFYERLENLAKNNKKIVFAGYVPDASLAILYNQALAYIFPSLYEGFGLPPLEAMSQNCPVISANSSCLPEIMGSAAEYFDPASQESMKSAIIKIYKDEDRREELIKFGRKRIQKFSWQECAQKTLEIYKYCVNKKY